MPRFSTLFLFLMTACVLGWPQKARAGGVAEFYSVLYYDEEWGTMNGYAETYLDFMTIYYYDTCTNSYLCYDSTTVDWGSQCVEQASSSVSTYSNDLVDGKDYMLITYHSLQATYTFVELYQPCSWLYCSSYDDRFGFSLLSEGTSSWESEHWMYSNYSDTPLTISTAKSGYTTTPIQHVGICGDTAKDVLVGEYTNPYYQAPADSRPQCSDVTDSSTSPQSAHFGFSNLNTGDYSGWAIIKSALTGGVDCVWDNRGSWPLSVESAYRNPSRNRQVGGATGSKHIYGIAVDFPTTSQAHWTAISDAGKSTSCNACREPLDQSGVGHVHLDWRGACDSGW